MSICVSSHSPKVKTRGIWLIISDLNGSQPKLNTIMYFVMICNISPRHLHSLFSNKRIAHTLRCLTTYSAFMYIEPVKIKYDSFDFMGLSSYRLRRFAPKCTTMYIALFLSLLDNYKNLLKQSQFTQENWMIFLENIKQLK